uniref:Uncharacterized protein n=1 Tax=Panagrolaimus sp. JU765 TaxID=591449 RepID=A0AC34RSZ3_9BILA
MMGFCSGEVDNLPVVEPEEIFGFAPHLYIFAAVNIIVNCTVTYLILFHSTQNMKFYKWFLLYSVVTAMIMDLHNSIIYGAYYLLPAMIACCTGICKNWGMYWGSNLNYMIFELDLAVMGFGLCALMIYRYHVLNGTSELMEKKWFILCLFLVSIIYLIPIYIPEILALEGMTNETVIDYINRTAPQYIKVVKTGICSAFVDLKWGMIYFVVAGVCIIFICGLALYYSIKSVLLLRRLRESMSATTYALQKQFIYSVFVQIAVPLFSFVLPVLSIIIITLLGCRISLIYSELFVKSTLLHAPLNGLAVLFTIKPYREALKQMVYKIFPKLKRSNLIQVQTSITGHDNVGQIS